MATLPLTIIILLDDDEATELTDIRRTYCRRAAVDAPGPFGPIEVVEHPIKGLANLELPSAGWIFLLGPGHVPLPFFLRQPAVALDAYDAVWGAHADLADDKGPLATVPETAMGCTTLAKLLFRHAEHWLTGSYFIRANAASAVNPQNLHDIAALLELWGKNRCTKLAAPFIVPRQQLGDYAFAEIVTYFRERSVVTRLHADGEDLEFRVAYWNPIIESHLVDGRLFEAAQLRALRDHVGPGATIVDVGANIGQHLVYFAKVLEASSVIPIEPNPNFVDVLKENIALNGLDNIDTSVLGIGAGAAMGKCRIAAPDDNPQNLTVDYEPDGEIPVMPLDDLATGPIDLVKIDVDESEIDVLQGMTRILSEVRPVLAVEVVHSNLEAFLEIIDRYDYTVDHLFPNPQYNDIVAAPSPAT